MSACLNPNDKDLVKRGRDERRDVDSLWGYEVPENEGEE